MRALLIFKLCWPLSRSFTMLKRPVDCKRSVLSCQSACGVSNLPVTAMSPLSVPAMGFCITSAKVMLAKPTFKSNCCSGTSTVPCAVTMPFCKVVMLEGATTILPAWSSLNWLTMDFTGMPLPSAGNGLPLLTFNLPDNSLLPAIGSIAKFSFNSASGKVGMMVFGFKPSPAMFKWSNCSFKVLANGCSLPSMSRFTP